MLLYILRHGQAELGAPGAEDAARRLTPEGEAILRRVLLQAARGGVKPDILLTSPYVRARQTASLAVQALGIENQSLPCEALVPDADPEGLWNELRLHRDAAQVLLVGHNPLLSSFLAALLSAAGSSLDLGTGFLACVDVGSVGARPRGRLLWLLSPSVCG